MKSVLYDAVVVAGGDGLADSGDAIHWLAEAYKHGKPVGALGAGAELLDAAPLGDGAREQDGVVVGDDAASFAAAFAEALGRHRFFDRNVARVPA